MTGKHYAFFEKDGKVEKAPLVKWGSYRRAGWSFSSEAAFNAQSKPAAEKETLTLPTMDDNKVTILQFAHDHEVTVDEEDTKAELLIRIEDVLG